MMNIVIEIDMDIFYFRLFFYILNIMYNKIYIVKVIYTHASGFKLF